MTNGWWAGHMPQRNVIGLKVIPLQSQHWDFETMIFLLPNKPTMVPTLAFHAARGEARMHFLLFRTPVSAALNLLLELGILASLTYMDVRR